MQGQCSHMCRMDEERGRIAMWRKFGLFAMAWLAAALTAAASLPSYSLRDFPIVGTSQSVVFQSLEEMRGLSARRVWFVANANEYTANATTTNSLTNAKTVTVSYASTTITSYRFDQNGNLVQQTAHGSSAVVWSYGYDAFNRMVTAAKACPTCDPLTVRFAYDPFNRRISKTVSTGSTTSLVQRFLWDRQSEIGAADASNNLVQLRFLGRGLGNEVGAAVAMEIRTNAASAWVVYVPIHDHRGNVVVLLNRGTGAVAEYYRSDAFGNVQIYSPASVLLADSAVGNPWQFASKRADAETGFVYFGRRQYSPQLGRFVTCDPLGFLDGPNRYLYAQANPLIMTDPSGLLARNIGANAVAWADANFSLVNDDWRYMPTMYFLDYEGMPIRATIQNSLLAPTWNLAAGLLNPMIDMHIYGSDSEYAAYFFIGMHPEIAMQMEYTIQAMGPLVGTTVGRVDQWLRGRGTIEPVVNVADDAVRAAQGTTRNDRSR